jgi:MinD-like ATPase involved in chromosome partitioning or flagellar assembly
MFALKGLGESDWKTLRGYLKTREVPKNEVIYEKNSDAVAMYFLESGAVKKVERKAKDGHDDEIIAVVKAGMFFGEEALLGDNTVYHHSVLALEPSTIYELSRESFQTLMMSAMSIGTRILLGISKDYREALVAPVQQATTWMFYSPKDGMGKTTLAVNTALLVAKKTGKRVGFIDLDFQFGNASLQFGSPPQPNMVRLIQTEPTLNYSRIQLFMTKREGVDFLWSSDLPQEAELVTRDNLQRILKEMSLHYDFLIIDAGGYIDDQIVMAWDKADRIVMVGRPDMPSLQRVQRSFRLFERLNFNRDRFIGVCNAYAPGGEEFFEEFKKVVRSPVFPVPYETETFCASEFHGSPAALRVPSSPGVKAIEKVVEHLLGKDKVEPKHRQDGIFGRLKSFFAGA